MHWRNRAFVAAALVYALLGGALALWWLSGTAPLGLNLPRMHGHLMTLGFVAMMIYGVGLHVLPRFSGRPLSSERLANLQFYLANAGLLLMLPGWAGGGSLWLHLGGGLAWLAMGLFAYNIVTTVRHYGPGG